ncbi:dihydrodipicolinate synthase family protein [Planctomicrobium sp. SH527]|uniref:dihydrodipicolinate synthase family protein n=1 Tax=Planctomicrobium sp. SH527 TaxID=3448123 RepID=UPI003F5C46C1
MSQFHLITALCTPLNSEEQLHVEGLEAHIEDQLSHGIQGLLAGGTMGVMQLLTEETWLDLINHSVRINAGRAELLVGVGDTGFIRTRDRIKMVDELDIDGIVVLSPFCIKFKQPELIHYFESLADVSNKPLYLYDLPQMTGTKLEVETVRRLASHPNIHGIKCSDQFSTSRPLLDTLLDHFRVIIAQPLLLDMLLRSGVKEHLDGIFGLVPHWMQHMVNAAENKDWGTVEEVQRDIAALLDCLINFQAPLFSSAAELLKERGIPGNVAPAPYRPLTPEQREQFLNISIIRKALASNSRVAI